MRVKYRQARSEKSEVLFLCSGNSCRSQMAEGFARSMHGDLYNFFSAGSEAHGINQYAVLVMKEAEIDISGQKSKTINVFSGMEFDYVVTVCGRENEECPFFPARIRNIHHGFDDPPKLAAGSVSEEEKLKHYRRVRDEMREFIKTLPELLNKP